MRIRNYFQIYMPVPTQADKDLINHIGTLLDSDSYWNTHDYTDDCWSKCNNGTAWLMTSPATDNVQNIVTAFLTPAPYSSPFFARFRDGKGDGLSFRAGINETDFELFRSKVVIGVQKNIPDFLTANGGVLDNNVFPV